MLDISLYEALRVILVIGTVFAGYMMYQLFKLNRMD